MRVFFLSWEVCGEVLCNGCYVVRVLCERGIW